MIRRLLLILFLALGVTVVVFFVLKQREDRQGGGPPPLPTTDAARESVERYLEAMAAPPRADLHLTMPMRDTHALLSDAEGRAYLAELANRSVLVAYDGGSRIASVSRTAETYDDDDTRIAEGVMLHFSAQGSRIWTLVDIMHPNGRPRRVHNGRIVALSFDEDGAVIAEAAYTDDEGQPQSRTFSIPWGASERREQETPIYLWVDGVPEGLGQPWDPYAEEVEQP